MVDIESITRIRGEIAQTGRDVTVIAAAKMQSADTLVELMREAPDFVLGENRVQELTAKYDPVYRWHFIGQLQTNKVKYIIDKVELIHSLDRIELAKEIEKQAAKHGKVQSCLVEVNMGSEISKGGVAPEDVLSFIKELEVFKHIKVEGIMSVLPNIGEGDLLDSQYSKLENLYAEAAEIKQDNVCFKYLSAGMTNDYRTALRHGSNMIRLGRVLFGERIYAPQQIAD